MGTFRVRIEVGGPDRERFVPVDVLITQRLVPVHALMKRLAA